MSELEQMWVDLLEKASLDAVKNERSDIADYLHLKLANDTIRRAGVEWLFDTFIKQAFESQQVHTNLKIERTSPHSFKSGVSTMNGSLVEIQYGVRCLSLEAGWVRKPSDGIMRDGALAQARMRHFGMTSENVEFRLVNGHSLPEWIDDIGNKLDTDELRRHLALLLDR